MSALYRDGIVVGRGQMALTPRDETLRLGFGADDKVKVVRAAQGWRLGHRDICDISDLRRRGRSC
jgi:hypothetical protein